MTAGLIQQSTLIVATGLGVSRNPADYVPLLILITACIIVATLYRKAHR